MTLYLDVMRRWRYLGRIHQLKVKLLQNGYSRKYHTYQVAAKQIDEQVATTFLGGCQNQLLTFANFCGITAPPP